MRPRDLFEFCFLHPVIKYVTAVVASLAAVLIRYELNPIFHDQSRYLLVLPVMLVWAIYGGIGPGLVVSVLGSLLTVAMLVTPADSPGMKAADANAFLVHCVMCVGFLWLVDRELKEKNRRKETERKLEMLNQALELKVEERTAELQTANAELESFCYSMAHDLRTPGRAMAGHSRILLEDHADELSPTLRNHLERIDRAANKLGSLIDSLLLYARLAQHRLQPMDVDIRAMVADLATSEAEGAGVRLALEIEDGLHVRADERQMRILFLALVKNSVLYRKPGQPAIIRLRKDRDSLVFEDEGIGFEMAYKEKVFRPFERLHRDEQYPGVGMGLANVARVVGRHGGEASVHAVPGRGTTVRLRLPGLTKHARELAGTGSAVR